MTTAPYEAIFLLPSPTCKSCGTLVPVKDDNCPKCGEAFHWSLREKASIAGILAYVAAEAVKEEADRILADFKERWWCRTHGFQKILPLEKEGKVLEVCRQCLANAMASPPKRPRTAYERENNLCRGVHHRIDDDVE
jgi:ribosomal protein L40E